MESTRTRYASNFVKERFRPPYFTANADLHDTARLLRCQAPSFFFTVLQNAGAFFRKGDDRRPPFPFFRPR
jgi:hypothetical protein